MVLSAMVNVDVLVEQARSVDGKVKRGARSKEVIPTRLRLFGMHAKIYLVVEVLDTLSRDWMTAHWPFEAIIDR